MPYRLPYRLIPAGIVAWLFLVSQVVGVEYNIPFAPRDRWDEVLRPTGDAANMHASTTDKGCANPCDGATNCYTYLDEDPDSDPDDDEHIQSGTPGKQGIFTFDLPAENVSTAAGAQRFNFVVSACTDDSHSTNPCQEDGADDPSIYLYVYCGVAKQSPPIYSAVAIGGDFIDELHTLDWTWDGDCAVDGSDFAIGLNTSAIDAGDDQRVTCWESIEWLVAH